MKGTLCHEMTMMMTMTMTMMSTNMAYEGPVLHKRASTGDSAFFFLLGDED